MALDTRGDLSNQELLDQKQDKYTDNARVGWANYFNTVTTPISIPSLTDTKLTLVATPTSTVEDYLPLGVSSIWDSVNSRFDFSSLEIGDMVDIRVDGIVTVAGFNESFRLDLVCALGTASQYAIPFASGTKLFAGTSSISRYNGIFIGSEETRDNPAELFLYTTAAATASLIDIYVKVLKRNG